MAANGSRWQIGWESNPIAVVFKRAKVQIAVILVGAVVALVCCAGYESILHIHA